MSCRPKLVVSLEIVISISLYVTYIQGYKGDCCNRIRLDFRKGFGVCLRENIEDFLGEFFLGNQTRTKRKEIYEKLVLKVHQ